MGLRFEPSSLLSPIVIATNKLEIENMSERRLSQSSRPKRPLTLKFLKIQKVHNNSDIHLRKMTVGGKIDLVLLPQVYTYSSVCTFLINDKPMCVWTWYIFRVAEPML